MENNQAQPTDDIIRDALNEQDVKKLERLSKELVKRMQPNETYLGNRVDNALSAVDRKINYYYQAQNMRTSRIIAYATIFTAIATAIFGYWQNTNIQQQFLLQQKQPNSRVSVPK